MWGLYYGSVILFPVSIYMRVGFGFNSLFYYYLYLAEGREGNASFDTGYKLQCLHYL